MSVSIKPSSFTEAPVIEENQSFTTDENVPIGTVIGSIKFELPNPDRVSISRFNVFGNNTFRIDNDGNIIVQGEVDYEYAPTYTFTIQAEDSKGNLSNNAKVSVKINDLDKNDGDDNDSGSFGWLALLAAPFALLRRKRK